uniref:Uncharacterized protein n=1 Tax=Romanomermis culicivorax TaxID=13658 RepID=A0A915HJH6_ROMCU
YVNCTTNCRHPDIVAKCGHETNDNLLLLHRPLMITIKLLTNLYHLIRTGPELKFYDTCDQLGTGPGVAST